jgi:aflatoxin B1 aldehyde reductase
VLATKLYAREPGVHKAVVIKQMLNKSLAELKTNCIDIFYLHDADRSVSLVETLEALNELHKKESFCGLD